MERILLSRIFRSSMNKWSQWLWMSFMFLCSFWHTFQLKMAFFKTWFHFSYLQTLIHNTVFSVFTDILYTDFQILYLGDKKPKWGHISKPLIPLEFFKNQTWSLLLQAIWSEIAPTFLRNTEAPEHTKAMRLYWLSVHSLGK